MITDIDKKLINLTEEIITEIHHVHLKNNDLKELFKDEINQKLLIKSKPLKAGELPQKEFHLRNSILTDLLEVKHISTIYHIFVVGMIMLLINTFIHDLVANGT